METSSSEDDTHVGGITGGDGGDEGPSLPVEGDIEDGDVQLEDTNGEDDTSSESKVNVEDDYSDSESSVEDVESSFKLAVKLGDVPKVKQFLHTHPELLSWMNRDNNGSNSLHIAARYGRFQLIKYFTKDCQIDPKTVDEDGWNTLHYASKKGSLEIVQYLMTVLKMDPKTVTKNGSNSLHIAACYGQFGLVRYFTKDCQMDPKTVDEDGWNTLHFASQNGSLEIVQYLMTVHRMDPKTVTKDGSNSLHIAAGNSWFGLVKYFTKDFQMDPQIVNENEWNTLHYASLNGPLEIVQYLMTVHRMDPKIVTKNGSNSLHIAARYGRFGLVKYFTKDFQMDPQTVDENGWNTLHCASQNGSLEIVQYLMTVLKMDPKTVTKLGESAIMLAQSNHHHHIEEYLMSLSDEGQDKSITLEKDHDEEEKDEDDNKESWNQHYHKAKDTHGSVIINVIRCVVCGASFVGKSSLKHLLAHNQSKEIHISTGVLERPEVVAVTSEQYQVEEGSSVWTLVTDSKMEGSIRKCAAEGDYKVKDTYPGFPVLPSTESTAEQFDQEHLVTDVTEDPCLSLPKDVEAIPVEQPDDMLTSLSKARDDLLQSTNLDELKLTEKTFIHLLDTGGQPEFQDSLPCLLTLPATYIHVFDSSRNLSQPVKQTYRPDSQTSESIPSSKSAWDVIQHSLSDIYTTSLRQPELPVEIKVPRLRMFLVGTFKDKLMEVGNNQEILHSIESHLKELNSKPYREHLVDAPDQTAFLVNNLMYLSQDHPATKEDQDYLNLLRSFISDKECCLRLEMPLMWYFLDLTIKRTPHHFIKCQDLKNFCLSNDYIDGRQADDQFLALLRLFHHFGFFAYYELKGVPLESNWVCTDTTFLYKEISKLLIIRFHPRNPQRVATKRFKNEGIINERDYQELIKEVGISEETPSEWLLQVLQKRSFTAEIGPGRFFMPMVLPKGHIEIPDCTAVQPLCFAFNFKEDAFSANLLDLPRSIFCQLAVHLAKKKKWKTCPNDSDRSTIRYTYGNLEVFLMDKPGRIEVAVFCFKSFILSKKGPCPADLKKLHDHCAAIKGDLKEEIEAVSRSIMGEEFLKKVYLQVCFICDCQNGSPHLALLSESEEEDMTLKCTRPKGRCRELHSVPVRKVWFFPVESTEATFTLKTASRNECDDPEEYWVLQEQTSEGGESKSQDQGSCGSIEEKKLTEYSKTTPPPFTDTPGPSSKNPSIPTSRRLSEGGDSNSVVSLSKMALSPSTSLQDAIQSVYTILVNQLCTKDIREDLFAKGIINMPLKQTIQNKNNSKEANEALVDHLYTSGTVESVKRFIQVLRDTSSSYEVHEEIAQMLEGALRVHKVTV